MNPLATATAILSRAHIESDISEAGLALPHLDQVAAEYDALLEQVALLQEQLTEANSGWSRAVRLVRMLAQSAGSDAMPTAIDFTIDYLREIECLAAVPVPATAETDER